MHGNAATVVALLVLAVSATSGEAAAKARLSKPAAVATVPPAAAVATPAAPVATPAAPVAQAPVAPEQGPVHRALAAAGKTYKALRTPDAKIEGPGAGSRAEQAKQIVAQLHPADQKAAVSPPAKQLRASGPVWPNMPRRGQTQIMLDAELVDAEAQVKAKLKELSVQTRLEKEKEEAAAQAKKKAIGLRKKAEKLRKEADVAAQIAAEKSVSAAKAEKGMIQTQGKEQKILEEEKVMQRFLTQTKKEELALERNISNIKLEEAKEAAKEVTTVVPRVVAKPAPSKVPVRSVAPTPKANAPMDREAMKRLMEENNRLKHEKAVLEQQLSDRKVAKEKAKLKQKLKNRLALADRHMKLQKSTLRTRH